MKYLARLWKRTQEGILDPQNDIADEIFARDTEEAMKQSAAERRGGHGDLNGGPSSSRGGPSSSRG
jgi:hypothetical protein